tara:strand:+ start:1211 stop:1552 length:342 start_codon:yes stop_codon:yes gene_type:complete
MSQTKTQIVGEVISGFPVTGVVTATKFVGDGSGLSGVAGFVTALSPDKTDALNQVFTTDSTLQIGAGTSVNVTSTPEAGNLAFSKAKDVVVGTGATFTIGAGTTLTFNVLGVF